MHPPDGGESRDFEDLVHAYYRPLYQFACSLVHDEADASDLTQQTFSNWAGKRHTLRDPSKVKTWLFTTLHREFLKSRRHDKQFPHRSFDETNDDLPNPSPSTDDKVDSGAVLEALAMLDKIYRAPVMMFYLGEHSYREISDMLSVPIGTVQSRICRGKALLRKLLTLGGANRADFPVTSLTSRSKPQPSGRPGARTRDALKKQIRVPSCAMRSFSGAPSRRAWR